MVDWTVGLAFGRASAELGALGHPEHLGAQLDSPPESEPGPEAEPVGREASE